jgi:predicted dehydrogenase
MKILVVGCGSIGQRHAANAASLADAAVFDTESSRIPAGLKSFVSLNEALAWKPDGVVVATPHYTHIEIAAKAVEAGAHVLIEKPISNTDKGVENFLKLAAKKGKQVFVVCNMRFHPAIKALRDNLQKIGKVYYARAQYGNYLPNMRPDADYKKLYCAYKAQGGGVILDAIHEIDYLSWFFGLPKDVSCVADTCSDLEIDVEDYASVNLHHANGVRSEIHLDYLQQHKRRGCEIIGSEGTLVWESNGKKPEICTVKLFQKSTQKWEAVFEDKDLDSTPLYKETMAGFIAAMNGNKDDMLDGVAALQELKAALGAKKSASRGKVVKL